MESLAEDQHDPQLVNMLRSKYLKEQVDSIAEIAKLVTQLNRGGGEGLGLYLFDQVKFYPSCDRQINTGWSKK
jgi:ferritin heavy chain